MMRGQFRLSRWMAGAVLAGVMLAAQVTAAAEPSGRFESEHGWFNVGGAYAFPARVGMDDQPGIKVAISNAGFNAEWIDRYWDREGAIGKFFQDDETLVAFLHFDAKGAFLGINWYWGSGTGCGFCSDSEAASTVKVKAGRIAGKVALKGKETTYDVTFDVPVAPATPGKSVATDGPAAAAYLAYHGALDGGNEEAVKQLVTTEDRERFAKAREAGENYLAILAEDHPRTVKVVRAFEAGDWAVLLVRCEATWGEGHGEVQMKREDGAWRYYDEFFDVGDWSDGLKP